MSNWRDYFKKKIMNTPNTITISAPTSGVALSSPFQTYNTTAGTGMIGAGAVTTGNITSAIAGGFGTIGGATTFHGGSTYTINPVPTVLFTAYNTSSKEIVRLNPDGSVVWNGEIDVDSAAEAFGRSLSMGAEISAGITKRVKLKMRDSVFEDIISIAKEKGSLSAEDLTYLLEASKIVEKLKGGKE